LKEAIATQILLGFLLRHYVVFIEGVSLKLEGGTWGGSLVSCDTFSQNNNSNNIIEIMSTVSSLTAIFSNIQLQLARYVYCPLYAAGNIGNILNLIVFSQAKVRTASVCSWYFLALSIANLISINTGYLTRILAYMGLPDPSRTVGWYCTGRVYISTLSLTLGRHFTCSIIVDRFLVTSRSVKLRRISSFNVAKWYVPLSVLCWVIFYLHIWVGYSSYQNGSACKRWGGAYTVFITVCTVTLDAVLPIVVMTIFSLLILNNLHGLRQRRNRVMPIIYRNQTVTIGTAAPNTVNHQIIQNLVFNQQERRKKNKTDKQLTLISLIQVLVYIICNTMNASYAVYSIITSATIRSVDRTAIESFISAVAMILTFIYGTVSKQFVSMTF
jgi:hypothetical protein